MGESEPLLEDKMGIPQPTFASIKNTPQGKRPQAIAHRGYKAAYPENTMGAYKGAVEVGADAIELDLHLSKDGVVVCSHDATLKRCYGKDQKIADCDWEYLSTLQTLREPCQPMPRLKDILEYLSTPGAADTWVLLDIKLPLPTVTEALWGSKADQVKRDEHTDDLFRLIAATLADVKTPRPWNQRVLIGCWAAKYLPLCLKYLPGYSITHIGFSPAYARQFLKVPGIGFNMFQQLVVGPRGNALIRDVKKDNRTTLLWTVNAESWMKWSIRKEVDGVITDDPKKYLEVCESYKKGEKVAHGWRAWRTVLWWNYQAFMFSIPFRIKHGLFVDVNRVKKIQ